MNRTSKFEFPPCYMIIFAIAIGFALTYSVYNVMYPLQSLSLHENTFHSSNIITVQQQLINEGRMKQPPSIPYILNRCVRNPFISFISDDDFIILERKALLHRLQTPNLVQRLIQQDRALWEQFIPVLPGACEKHIIRLGGEGDGGKLICGLEQMDDTNCIIFSLGSNNDWTFEQAFLHTKKKCRTITFDCTGDFTVPANITDRAEFRKICYGVQNENMTRNIVTMMQENNVAQLNLLKMDIEWTEWLYFRDMRQSTLLEQSGNLPDQIVVEIHWMPWKLVAGQHPTIYWLADLVDGWFDLGYRIVAREMNPTGCFGCYEVTLVRFRC